MRLVKARELVMVSSRNRAFHALSTEEKCKVVSDGWMEGQDEMSSAPLCRTLHRCSDDLTRKKEKEINSLHHRHVSEE